MDYGLWTRPKDGGNHVAAAEDEAKLGHHKADDIGDTVAADFPAMADPLEQVYWKEKAVV